MLPDRVPSRRTSCGQKRRLLLGNLGWVVLAAALMPSCIHRADRTPKPVTGTATVTRTSAPPAPAPRLAQSPPSVSASEPVPPRALPGSRVGAIRAIGTGGRFVLLEAVSAGFAPSITEGQELRCIHSNAADANGPFAIVRVSRERRPPFIVADVLSGQPQAGDDVYHGQGRWDGSPPRSRLHPVGGFLVHPGRRPPAGCVRRFPRTALAACPRQPPNRRRKPGLR